MQGTAASGLLLQCFTSKKIWARSVVKQPPLARDCETEFVVRHLSRERASLDKVLLHWQIRIVLIKARVVFPLHVNQESHSYMYIENHIRTCAIIGDARGRSCLRLKDV
jgi:hypothetical protein